MKHILMLAAMAALPLAALPQSADSLGRGLVAVQADGYAAVSWRYLPTDGTDAAFDVYRRTGRKAPQRLNSTPLTGTTFWADSLCNPQADNVYTIRRAGSRTDMASARLCPKPYIEIDMAPIADDPEWRYQPNDASAADLDGDGEYELIVTRTGRAHDNSHRGVTDPVLIEAYKLDGRLMWRVSLGRNIRAGAHYTPFIVFDFDGDGRAELAVRTSDGTTFADGTAIGDTAADYVDSRPDSPTYGMVTTGPEYLSVIDGLTGCELARADYIARGEPFEFGDNYANRVDRFLAGVGMLGGPNHSIIICRGYYAKTVVEAWDYADRRLERRWRFDTQADGGRLADYEGQGNHNLSVADVDGDGFDEITYGACLIDHDGRPGYNTRLGHGDAIHLTDIDIDRPGLEVWDCHESVPTRAGSEMRDARTGELLWGVPSVDDVGRALAADVDPRFRGCEAWTLASGGIYTANGRLICPRTPSINFAIWWDGDLSRELLDGSGVTGRERVRLSKWTGHDTQPIALPGADGVGCNNWTKGNPCLQADIVGDWREEIVVRTLDNRHVRIFTTTIPTPHRFHCLMTDHVYRIGVALQNVGYNQPPHTGFYLGSDLGVFGRRVVHFTGTGDSKHGRTADGSLNDMDHRMQGATIEYVTHQVCRADTATLDAGCDYQSVVWSVGGREVGRGRTVRIARPAGPDATVEVDIRATQYGAVYDGRFTVSFEP